MSSKYPLASVPSFSSVTLLSEKSKLAYWWSENDETSLKIYDYEEGTRETVGIDGETLSPEGWEPIFWLGDQFLVQTRPDLYLLDLNGAVEELQVEDEYANIVDIDSAAERLLYVYYPEGLGPSDEPWTLRLYDRGDDNTTVLTEHPEQWGHAGFSPDGERIAYRENPTESFGEGQIVVADGDGEEERTITVGEETARTQLYGWHPDGRRLLLDDRSDRWYRVGLHDLGADEATWFGTGQYNEFPLTILPDGDRLVNARFQDGKSTAVVYSIDERDGRELDLARGVVRKRMRQPIGESLASGHVLLKHETPTRPPRLLNYDLAADEASTLIDTQTNELAARRLVDAEHVTYESDDGVAVNAVLHRAPESPSPAVVKIHGGPTTAVQCGFDPDAQFLASEGYTVFQPNYRGSTDQDRAFEEAIKGEMGEGAVDDVAAGARWLAQKDWIDEGNLAAFGHSAGAYLAAMQAIRHPDLWQVVIPENGGLDRVAILSDPNQYALRHIIEDPEVETEEQYLRRRSPVHRTEDVGCPVCIIQGERDAVEMSEDFVEGLKERGWTEGEEFRFEVLEDEGHVVQDRERLWDLVVEMLEQYTTSK